MKWRPRFVPPIYFLATILVMATLDQFLEWGQYSLGAWRWLGVLDMLAGFAVTLVAARTFRSAKTPVRPGEQPTQLVESGLFRYTRNPMYAGMLIFLLGTGWLLQSMLSWFAILPFFFVLDRYFIPHEEALMQQTFGDSYRAYQARVRRWI